MSGSEAQRHTPVATGLTETAAAALARALNAETAYEETGVRYAAVRDGEVWAVVENDPDWRPDVSETGSNPDTPPPAGTPATLTCYCGWGYEPGPHGETVHVYTTGDGRVLGVAGARVEGEADEDGVHYSPEWDQAGWLPADATDTGWPPRRDLDVTRAPLTDDERDDYADEIRDALREVLHD